MEQIAEQQTQQACPVCGVQADYYELECAEPFTAPAPLAVKALTVWGVYGADKELLHQQDNLVHFRFGNSTRLVKMLGWNQETWESQQEAIHNTRTRCEEEGCEAEGYPCFTLFEPDQPLGYYCEAHMNENGVCPGCHRFMAGFESFDFSETGYCGGCSDFLRDEMDDARDDEGNWDY